MQHWLIKTEPGTWSWAQQKKVASEHWDGVRNYQAQNNLKKMTVGDLAFFYHSGDERQIMGIVRIVRTFYPDHTDASQRFGMVDVAFQEELGRPVTLSAIKARTDLSHLALVKQSRLSVMPIDPGAWDIIYKMGQNA